MSSDQQVLEAIAMKTRQEMRYFELVKATCGESPFNCYMCLGKHAIFFVGPDLNKIHEGWEVFYAYLMKVVQDRNSENTLMLVLADNKSQWWKSDRLFIRCENRELMLKHLRCSWQTDHMWRVGRVGMFPLSRHELTKEQFDPPVKPFINYKWVTYNQYCLMVPCDFECQPNSIQAGNTGEYINESGISLHLHVHEPLTFDQLGQMRRDHIRWVAEEYKLQLVRGERQFYVLRNQQRQKRMNLAGDMAAWYCWEIIIMTPSATLICLLLRRQFIPPVCNTAQDIAVLLRCPLDNKGNLPKALLIEAHLIADSICPDAPTVIPYRKIVKAKLDGLRFDDESFDWIKSHLKLNTRWQNYAKAFLKAILRIFVEGNPKTFGEDFLRLPELKPEEHSSDEEAEERIPEDLDQIIREVESYRDEMLPDDRTERLKVKNRWVNRVARYFAWAVDGGVLHSKFTLDIMVEHITLLPDAAYKNALKALRFMLHVRPLDMTKPYDESPLVTHLKETNLKEFTFNDRVIRALLTQDYLRKRLGRQNDADYFECLANLLNSNAGTHVKAYICRIFMERNERKHAEDENSNLTVVPSLVHIIDCGGPFLATYASAALVNLSDGNDAVKMKLFEHNIAGLACKSVKTKDDELICYTLMLLVNLTKQPHHRAVMANTGFLPLLYDLLTSSYHLCKTTVGIGGVSGSSVAGGAMKVKLLTQVCILIGHFSIEETYREFFLDEDTFGHTVACLLWMFDESDAGGSLMCKVMFALKQLCKDRNDQKQFIGAHTAGRIIERLAGKSRGREFERTSEFLFQSILLLQMLVTHSTNCQILDRGKDYWEKGKGFEDYLDELVQLPQTKKIHAFEERVRQLKEDVQVAVFKDLGPM